MAFHAATLTSVLMELMIAMSIQFAQIKMDLSLAYVNPATEGTGVNVKR